MVAFRIAWAMKASFKAQVLQAQAIGWKLMEGWINFEVEKVKLYCNNFYIIYSIIYIYRFQIISLYIYIYVFFCFFERAQRFLVGMNQSWNWVRQSRVFRGALDDKHLFSEWLVGASRITCPSEVVEMFGGPTMLGNGPTEGWILDLLRPIDP